MKRFSGLPIYCLLLVACRSQESDVFDLSRDFQSLDRISFSFASAFDGYCSVVLTYDEYNSDPYEMEVKVSLQANPDYRNPESSRKAISKEQFQQFEGIFWDLSLLEQSLKKVSVGTDGCWWTICGTKGGIEICHRRFCPGYAGDQQFVSLGKLFMGFAGVEIPEQYLEVLNRSNQAVDTTPDSRCASSGRVSP